MRILTGEEAIEEMEKNHKDSEMMTVRVHLDRWQKHVSLFRIAWSLPSRKIIGALLVTTAISEGSNILGCCRSWRKDVSVQPVKTTYHPRAEAGAFLEVRSSRAA